MSSESTSTGLPTKAHAFIVALSFLAAIVVMSGYVGPSIPAGVTALVLIIGGNSLGHLFARYKNRDLKMLDRMAGVFTLYGVSVLLAYYVIG